ncbi:MAG: hypothetical protein ACLP8X_39550 [Streptosporangiaceae bacterium]
MADLGPLFAGALGIALVSLADTISTASVFAAPQPQGTGLVAQSPGLG